MHRGQALPVAASNIQVNYAALFVVLASPQRNLSPRIEEIAKPVHVQELVPHSAMKAFDAAAL